MSSYLLAQTNLPNLQSGSFFEGFSTDQRFALVVVAIICVVGLSVILTVAFASVWSAIKLKQIEADIKRDMLDRGMTAEEIEQVIEAVPRSGFERWMGSWCKKRPTQTKLGAGER
jgi:hypothetical protein